MVIPTYNRSELLRGTLAVCARFAKGLDVEFVVVDDGSSDDTAIELEKLTSTIPKLVWRRVENGGPGQARNLGASLASRDVVLFLGDDIRPINADFFRVHAEMHARRPSRDLAVLGKVVWPSRRGSNVNFVRAHLQGRDGEQFGYADLQPFSFLDWRFFYTANVSVKRDIVDDWLAEGFSPAFPLAAYEDSEFAYRMMQRVEEPLRILYVPATVGTHHHPFDVDAFMNRQTAAGMMSKVFTDLHPGTEVRDSVGLGGVHHALHLPLEDRVERNIAHYLSVIEGIKSWTRILDERLELGSHHWHDDLLKAVFSLCYHHGYVKSWTEPGANYAAAYYFLLEEFWRQMNHAVHVELSDLALQQMNAKGPIAGPPLNASWLARSRLWRWARSKPLLYALYQRLRRVL